MLKKLLPLVLLALTSACAGHRYYSSGPGMYVRVAPPPPRYGIYGVAPSRGFVWTEGYWDYRPGGWHWMRGSWQRPPHPRARWVPGYWRRGGGGYRFRPGYWR